MLTIIDIMKILPHRYPMLLVDRVLEMDPGKRIVCIKNVTANEQFFQGHFPGAPVMPGVLIVEAMAQCGAVLVLSDIPDRDKKLFLFGGVDKARFRKPGSGHGRRRAGSGSGDVECDGGEAVVDAGDSLDSDRQRRCEYL